MRGQPHRAARAVAHPSLGWLLAACALTAPGLCPARASAQAQGAEEAAPARVDAAPAVQVNLNSATVAELQRLPGVGPSRAEAIVAYRAQRPFRRVEELMRIRGIGRKTFRRLRPMLTVRVEDAP